VNDTILRSFAGAAIQMLLLAATALAQVDTATVHIDRAHHLIAQGKTQQAIAEYEAAVAMEPANEEAQGNLGVLEFFANRCSAALPHLNAALGLNASEPRIQALAGVCEKRQGQNEDAERNLVAALPQLPNPKLHNMILSNLAEIEYTRGELSQAATYIEELMKSEPSDPDVLYLAFRIYNDLADSARDKLTIAAPESGRIHLLMAEEFIKAGDASSAVHQYELALKQDSSFAGVHFELGEALLKESLAESSLTRATAELQLALKEDPRNAAAEAKLGFIESFRGHAVLAEEHDRRALSLNPSQLEALLGMAQILRERGENDKAAEFLARASVVSPLDETIHLQLAQIDRKRGLQEEAGREMKLFKEIHDLKSRSSLTDARRAPE